MKRTVAFAIACAVILSIGQGKASAAGRPDVRGVAGASAERGALVAAARAAIGMRVTPSQPATSNPLLEWARERQKQAIEERREGRAMNGPVQPADETSEQVSIGRD